MIRKSIDRRSLLVYSGMLGLGVVGSRALGAVCAVVPGQTEGPFYPVVFPSDRDADLTFIPGQNGRAVGLTTMVEGVVTDANCRPVAGAVVEIWQACANGRYNDERDPNTAARDPNFQGYGKVTTDRDGRYRFKTIKPGSYPTDPSNPSGWIRPPHIHYKVSVGGRERLTTQLYFAGEPLNERDEILLDLRRRVGTVRANQVVVAFSGLGDDADPLVGTFDIALAGSGHAFSSDVSTPAIDD